MGSEKIERVALSFSNDNHLATIVLGDGEESSIVLTPARMTSLVDALQEVHTKRPKGLVIRAPSPTSFCVGADISLIQNVTDPAEGAKLATQGQDAYNLLEDLPCTTVAAISGPCVGGGCELALACDYRILSDSAHTTIGLPETKLGILPGFGGTYRLPRLVGLPFALDIILAGKILKGNRALKVGLADALVAEASLYDYAQEIALGLVVPPKQKMSLQRLMTTNLSVGRKLVAATARKKLLKQTKGFYPAPQKALELCHAGLGLKRNQALKLESSALGELIVTPESKALVHIFFLTENAKALGKSHRSDVCDMHGLVVGAGTMGAGIAGLLASSAQSVIVKDTSLPALERGKAHLKNVVSKRRGLSSFEKAKILNKIDWLQYNSETTRRTDIIIEAVFENIDLKRSIFSELSSQVSSQCIIASNTSSLSVTEMSESISSPERFIGMHFFNPVERMPLVELIRAEKTSDGTVAKAAAISTALGKFPIVVRDVPGFLVNRILIPYLNEAIYLLEAGHSVEAIDHAALAFGMPMGPIRLLDEVGLDVAAHVSEIMVNGYGERMAVPSYAKSLLQLDRKGKKNRKGFYDYTCNPAKPWSGLTDALHIPLTPSKPLDNQAIQERLILHLINEAMKCLLEGVAGEDPVHAKKQIDLGMVMGIGFPPFRGGVLYYAESVGMEHIKNRLSLLSDEHGIRYTPWVTDGASVSNGS